MTFIKLSHDEGSVISAYFASKTAKKFPLNLVACLSEFITLSGEFDFVSCLSVSHGACLFMISAVSFLKTVYSINSLHITLKCSSY
jgi:hypothetical protein